MFKEQPEQDKACTMQLTLGYFFFFELLSIHSIQLKMYALFLKLAHLVNNAGLKIRMRNLE